MAAASIGRLPLASDSNMSQLRVLQLRALAVLAVFAGVLACITATALLCFGWVVVPTLLLAEILVWPCMFLIKWRRLNAQPLVHAPPPSYDPHSVFDRFTKEQAKLSKYLCIQTMLRKWFWNVPISDIKKGNVADLLTYGFWYKTREQLEAEGQGHLPDQLVREIEQAWGIEFEPGYNKDLPFMAHLVQNLRCHYRPMVFYLCIEVLFAMKHIMLLGTGFRSYSHRGYTFYTYNMNLTSSRRASPKQHSASAITDGKTPVLFLHGVGMGLMPYATFMFRLAASGQPVLAIESNHLGMRWVPHCPSEDEVVDAIPEILDQCRVKNVSVVGHSYGTFMASRLLQRFPQRVQSLVLIDPVCFVMFSGKLILNFVYEPHKSALTTWFVARDIHHSASVCRNFFWSLLNLWPDQLPDKTLVVLSGQDELVPVEETIKMLKSESKAEILYHTHHCHAEFIKDLAWQDKVVSNVLRLASQGDIESTNGLPEKGLQTDSAEKLLTLDMDMDLGRSCSASIKAARSSSSSLPAECMASEKTAEALQGPASGVSVSVAAVSTVNAEVNTKSAAKQRLRQHGRMDSASSWQGAQQQLLQEQKLLLTNAMPLL